MKNLLYTLICLFITTSLQAQQIPLFSNNSDYHAILNHAVNSIHNKAFNLETTQFLSASYRKQWAMIDDAPQTAMIRYDRLFTKLKMLGGLSLISDKTGPTSITGGNLRYAYQITLDELSTLSVGLGFGVFQYRYNGSQSLLRDAYDIVGLESSNKLIVDFNLGIYFSSQLYNGDSFFVGASIPQLATAKISEVKTEEDYYVYRIQHYFANAGYYKYLEGFGGGEGASYIVATLGLKHVPNAPTQMTANVNLLMTELLWIGGGVANSFGSESFNIDQFRFEAGFMIGDFLGFNDRLFRISYGFEKSITTYGSLPGSTHEINLSYAF